MPLLRVEALIEQLRQLPQDSYVALEGPDGALTTDILPPEIETIRSVTPDNPDEDEQAFIDEFFIVDWEIQLVAIRFGHTPDDLDPANDQ